MKAKNFMLTQEVDCLRTGDLAAGLEETLSSLRSYKKLLLLISWGMLFV